MTQTPGVASQESDEDLFVQFAESVLTLLKKFADAEGVPEIEGSFLEFTENACGQRFFRMPNYWHVYHTHMREIVGRLNPADRCVRRYLESGTLKAPQFTDAAGSPIPNPNEEQVFPWAYGELMVPLLEAVSRERTFDLTRERIRQCYKQFENRDRPAPAKTTMDVSIPLLNFTTELPKTRVGRMLDLEPLTVGLKTDLWNRSFAPVVLEGKSGPVALIGSRFILTGSYEHTAGGSIPDQPIFSDARRIVTALRLLKPGAVGVFANFAGTREGRMVSAFSAEELSARRPGIAYTLGSPDLDPLRALIRGLQQNEAGLRIAIRRFNLGYGRESGEDRVIDCAIALESCLLRGTGGQLSYRFSLRGAALLAGSTPPRATRDLLDAVYQARNEIVHGGGELSKLSDRLKKNLRACTPSIQPHELPDQCENITREILRTYVEVLDPGKSVEDVNRGLDDRIADALTLRSR